MGLDFVLNLVDFVVNFGGCCGWVCLIVLLGVDFAVIWFCFLFICLLGWVCFVWLFLFWSTGVTGCFGLGFGFLFTLTFDCFTLVTIACLI